MRSLLYRQLASSLSVASCEQSASSQSSSPSGDRPDANDDDAETQAEAAAARHATFRKRRLTKAYHHREQGNGSTDEGDDGRTRKLRHNGSTAESPRRNVATTTSGSTAGAIVPREEGMRRQQRDTFLYAREMEGLDEYLRDRRHRHDSNRSRRYYAGYADDDRESLLPFPRDVVGTYSCHGMEPLLMRRFMSRLPIDGLETILRHHPPPIAKINQDRGGIAHPYGNDRNTALFAVFDGHGIHGEDVAQFAMYETISRLKSHQDFETDTPNALREVFLQMDEALEKAEIQQSTYSGSTACCVLMRKDVLYVSNLGDSRAVLARRRGWDGRDGGSHDAIELTRDHNPDLPGERDRIVLCGGHVSSSPGDGSSARVWLDPEHRKLGLAMSRSVGDHALKRVGVSAEPEVAVHRLAEDDDFVVIATDGVWEFMDSSEVIDLVAGCLEARDGTDGGGGGMGASEACELLIEVAASRWKDHEGDYRDDITAIVVRVKDLWDSDERNS